MNERALFVAFLLALVVWSCGRESEAAEPTIEDRVFSVLQSLPRSKWDAEEPTDEREARLDFLAVTIATASRDESDAAALLTILWFESRGARYVQAGCRSEDIPIGAPNCSGGRARSPWQLERVACQEGWALPRGSDAALLAFATCARRRWRGALTRCEGKHAGGRLAGSFAGYRSVDCAWEGGPHQGSRARARGFQVRFNQLISE